MPINDYYEDLGEEYYLSNIEEMLENSVKNRMISDVPLGAYLSGGLDSSLLTAIMAKNSKSRVKTFSIGYDDDNYNEGKYAEIVSKYCNTDHNQIKISQTDYLDNWIKLINQKDAPLSIPHEIPLFKMSMELKKYITVVLSGEGADELFGGYGRVQRSPMDWKKIKFAKSLLGSRFSNYLAKIADPDSLFHNLKFESHMDHFLSNYNWVPIEQKFDLFSKELKAELKEDETTLRLSRIYLKIQKI